MKMIATNIKHSLIVCLGLFLSYPSFAQELNKLLEQLGHTQTPAAKISILHQIGFSYQKQDAHKKAIEYFEQAYKTMPGEKLSKVTSLKGMGTSFKQLKDYSKAIYSYEKILQKYTDNITQTGRIAIVDKLAGLHTLSKDYKKAIEYQLQAVHFHEQSNHQASIATIYNNLGFLYKKLERNKLSFKYYHKALEINQKLHQSNNEDERAIALLNTGVAYTSNHEYKIARNYYLDALKVRERQKKTDKIAEVYNYLGVHYYLSGNNTHAITLVKKAVEHAEPIKAEEVLANSYKLLARIYQQEKDFETSQKYYRKYQKVKERLEQKRKKQRQDFFQKQIDIEKEESELKELIAEKERQEAALQRSELERQQQEQALQLQKQQLALLRRDKELQEVEIKNQLLEKGRVEQLLALAEQKALAEKQKALADRRKQEVTRQRLLAEKEKAENMQRAKELEAAQKEKELHKKQLEQEQSLRQYGTIILGLGALLLAFILVAFRASQKSKRRLTAQNQEIQVKTKEIAAQNEELVQNQEELLTQRDFISEKNKELEDKNRQINSSIRAAQTIQQAILPYQKKVDILLKEYFVLYQPKDVVSGDFFWLNKIGQKTLLVVADCTGHGVQGAFMTLIGNTLLDKIIRVWNILEPKEILERLHEEVQIVLNQQQTGNNNGMDAVVIVLEPLESGDTKVLFSGAKNPLYYIHGQQGKIQKLKGDRKAIGGEQSEEREFTTKTITLPSNSRIYLGSDGLVDQNNNKRKRLGPHKVLQLLEDTAQESLAVQKQRLEATLADHMQGTTQRDDILFIGFKV